MTAMLLDFNKKFKPRGAQIGNMTTAYEEILKILANVEKENNIPDGTLRQIYDMEKAYVHLRNRDHIHDHLQGIISNAVKGTS